MAKMTNVQYGVAMNKAMKAGKNIGVGVGGEPNMKSKMAKMKTNPKYRTLAFKSMSKNYSK